MPAKSRSRFHLATLGARTAAAVGIGAAAILIVGGLLAARASGAIHDLERSQYAEIAADARLRLDRLVGRDRNRMMDAAFSDELYELLGRGAAPPDSFIRPRFADQFPAQFGDRFVAVYDLGGRRLYAWADGGQSQLEVVASNPLFRILDNREPAVGLVRHGERLFWVAGAPILPTNYTAPDQPIRGYLVVAQPFHPGLAGLGGSGRAGRVELSALEPSPQAFRTRVGPAATRDSVRIEFALSDIFARQNTLAAFTTSRSEFRLLEGRLLSLALVGALAIAALAVVGYLVVSRFLVTPVARLSEALAPVNSGQAPGLIGSIAPAAEWTTLVGAVNRLVSNNRAVSEHFERLVNVVADGAWIRELATGDWTVTSRFRELVGYQAGEFPNPLAALAARVSPDDAAPLLAWLGAEVPSPPAFAADIRVRRGDDVAWVRIEGELHLDSGGLPARVAGRISDLTGMREAEARVAAASDALAERQAAEGRFLLELAADLPTDSVAARHLGFIGQGMAGTLAANDADCDLHELLQEAAGTAELSIEAGIAGRVEGDRDLLHSLVALLMPAGNGGGTRIRADRPDRDRPDRVRILVDDRIPADPESIAKIMTVLTTGTAPSGEPLLAWRAVHYLAKALGGEAGIDGDPTGTRAWVTVPLPPAVAAAPAPGQDLGLPELPAWETERSTDATFEFDPAPEPASRPSRPSGRVELVADATVTIDLDDPVSTGPIPPVGERFLGLLEAGDQAARRLALIALAEIPARLAELKGAAKAGEIGAVIDGAETVARVAAAIEAVELGVRCRDLVDAAESQYLDASDDLTAALDAAWGRLHQALGPYRGAAEPAPQPINPATLEQLGSSLGEGGLGTQLMGLVLAEAPRLVEAIESGAARGDWLAVKTSAGDLKGMCGLIGAEPLAARCSAAIEAVGSDAGAEVLAIRAEWNRVDVVLDGLMSAPSGAVT